MYSASNACQSRTAQKDGAAVSRRRQTGPTSVFKRARRPGALLIQLNARRRPALYPVLWREFQAELGDEAHPRRVGRIRGIDAGRRGCCGRGREIPSGTHARRHRGARRTAGLGACGICAPRSDRRRYGQIRGILCSDALARAKMEAEASGARQVQTELRFGDSAGEIQNLQDETGADAIVLGSRGRRLAGLLLEACRRRWPPLRHARRSSRASMAPRKPGAALTMRPGARRSLRLRAPR